MYFWMRSKPRFKIIGTQKNWLIRHGEGVLKGGSGSNKDSY